MRVARHHPRLLVPFVLSGFALATAPACNSDRAVAVYTENRAQDLSVYESPTYVKTRMRTLAALVVKLDGLLGAHDGGTPDNAGVVDVLQRMEEVARSLDSTSGHASHRLIEENATRLVVDLQRARMAAQQTPPELASARNITNVCLRCHAQSGARAATRR